ncbi:MAG: hypothetical protein QNJ00_08210 [Woeseiaceae bacterium]|nr:hypothetical protein [Woeseiaceae bacterium]
MAGLLAASTLACAEDWRFDGVGSGRSAVFATDGPWLLDWTATARTTGLTIFELRLHDGETGELLGKVVELRDTGSGKRLFERAGSYELRVVGREIDWQLLVTVVSEERAGELRRAALGETTLEDAARAALKRVPEGSFESWRPESNEVLLLFHPSGQGFRVEFAEPCPGLAEATALSFVSSLSGSIDEYDSILLDDGTRCHFARAVPTVH